MADFCTVDDLIELLQIDISDADAVASAERAITEATAAIKNYCHQEIALVEDDEITLDVWARTHKLVLPQMPVISVASVVEDGETLTEGDDEDYVLVEHGILYRVGQFWAVGPQIVTVTYTHGYSEIPQNIVDICARAAARVYQAGLMSAATDGVPGISATSLGDYSVSYNLGQSGLGLLGVSGARLLLKSEKEILDLYRYKP